jgi:hypothetical protein
MAKSDAQAMVEQTRWPTSAIHVLRAHIQIDGSADVKMTAEPVYPYDPGRVILCCCSGTALFKRLDSQWSFIGWTEESECY